MTEQEAIKNLKHVFSKYELDLPCTDALEILHMTISALEKQKVENMRNDLISRKELINLLYKTFNKYKISTDKTSTIGGFGQEVFDEVRKLPAAYVIEKDVELQVIEEGNIMKTKVTETIFNGASIIIPMSSVQHVEKLSEGINVITDKTKWNYQ